MSFTVKISEFAKFIGKVHLCAGVTKSCAGPVFEPGAEWISSRPPARTTNVVNWSSFPVRLFACVPASTSLWDLESERITFGSARQSELCLDGEDEIRILSDEIRAEIAGDVPVLSSLGVGVRQASARSLSRMLCGWSVTQPRFTRFRHSDFGFFLVTSGGEILCNG